jgi:hypothetical protein
MPRTDQGDRETDPQARDDGGAASGVNQPFLDSAELRFSATGSGAAVDEVWPQPFWWIELSSDIVLCRIRTWAL